VNKQFPTLPFTLRAGDERSWRLGVTECVKHGLFIECVARSNLPPAALRRIAAPCWRMSLQVPRQTSSYT
jgi:hypothetical protein